MRSDRVAGVGLVLIAGAIAWEARTLPFGTLFAPGPGYWPMLLAGALALLGGAVAALAGDAAFNESQGATRIAKPLAVLACCGFVALAMEPLGYRVTIALAVVFLLGIVERKHPVVVAVAAATLALGTHYLIEGVLKVPLPHGFWGSD